MIDERRSETRNASLHVPLALALVAVGVGHVLVEGWATLTVLRAAFPLALGGFVVLVVGTSRMLLAGTTGIAVAGGRAWWVPGLLTATGSLGLYAALGGRPAWLVPSALAWGLGLAVHVGTIGYSLARGRTQVAFTQGWPVGVTTLAALGYGLASALAIPLVALERLTLFAALHLVVTGFVVLAIAAVVLEVFPRFTGEALPGPWAGGAAVSLALGPMLLAEGFQGSARLLRAGGVVEGLGLVLLGAGLVYSVLATSRRRTSMVAYAAAGLAVVAGAGVGAGMALEVLGRGWAAWHGAMALLGFVGLLVVGAVVDLYAPALGTGEDAVERHDRAVVGLVLAGTLGLALVPWLSGPWARVGLGLYLAGLVLQLAGSLDRLWR